MAMKKSWWLILGFAIGITLFVIVFQTFSFSDFIEVIKNISPELIIWYLVVSIAIFMLLAFRWQIVNRVHKINVPFRRTLGYRYVGFAVSFITPGPRVGGEPMRAALLTQHDVKFPRALSSAIADKTIELTSFGVMFLITLIVALVTVPLPQTITLIFTIIAIFIFFLLVFGFTQMLSGRDPVLRLFTFFRLHNIKGLKKYEKELQEFEKNIVGFYKENKREFWKAQAVSALAWLISLVEYKLLLLMMGLDASFIEVLLIYAVVGFVYLIPIPLALGILELGQAGLFAALGYGAAAGAFLALMTRARDLLWTFVGFVMLSYYGYDKVRRP